MSVSSESAEQLIRICLDETEFALKITGSAIVNIATALYAISKDTSNKTGKTKLKKMLKSNSELKIFSVKKDEMKIFASQAKSYGVLYCALINKENEETDKMVDLMVRAEDAPKVNRIIERFHLSTVDKAKIKKEIELEQKIDNERNDAPEIGVEHKDIEDSILDEIMTKPSQKEEKQVPLESKTKELPQSENFSTSKRKLEDGTKAIPKPEPETKPSVKKELKDIESELDKKNEKTKNPKSKTKKVSRKKSVRKEKVK